MSSYGAEPERQPDQHGLDVTAMSMDIAFHTTGEVDVTANVTGAGTDVSNFHLYGASNDTSPSSTTSDLLSSSSVRPVSMSGQSTWTANEDYTVEMTYSKGTGANARTAKWYYTVPKASIPDKTVHRAFTSLTMTKRT